MLASQPSGLIAYRRVSTDKQGEFGLGMSVQEKMLEDYAKSTNLPILKTYIEVESGKKCNRPQLAFALAHAKRSRARLVVAKLDRLGRNVAFLSKLIESGVDFVAADMPHANTLVLHLMASFAEYEGKVISERTKAALAAAKARGVKLGNPSWNCNNVTKMTKEQVRKGIENSAKTNHELAVNAYLDLKEQLVEWHNQRMTRTKMAELLNEEGHTTRRGCKITPKHVERILRYLGIIL